MTNLAAVWSPEVWITTLRERLGRAPSIFNSGLVQRGEIFDALATGPGATNELPFWRDMSDDETPEEIQVENTAPSTNGLGYGSMSAAVLNRVAKFGATALSAQIIGQDPVAEVVSQLARWRLRRRQATLMAIMRGVMGTGAQTPNQAQGCLRANRLDIFSETGGSPTAEKLIDTDAVISAISLLGEDGADLEERGAIWMHSQIKGALEKIDASGFKSGVESDGRPIRSYRGIPLFVSDKLVRAGTTSGFVYDTYIASAGQVAYGEKPQTADTGTTIDVAALQFDVDKDKNNAFIWDRTRFVFHVNGTRWTGTPAGQSAANAELQAHGNWELVASSASKVGIVCIRSNG
jgi:hypothetical protein